MATKDTTQYPDLKARVQRLGCDLNRSKRGNPDVYILDPNFDGNEMQLEIYEVAEWCRNRETAAPHLCTDSAAWQAGVDIAFKLLEEADDIGLDEMALTDHCRAGRPQRNVFLKHLLRLRALNNATSDLAFCAVMSEFVAMHACDEAGLDRPALPIATTAEVARG